MLTDVVERRRRRRRVFVLRQQTTPDDRQRPRDNHQARDPQQSDGTLVAKLITHGVAEIDKVQQNQDRQEHRLEERFMATVQRHHG